MKRLKQKSFCKNGSKSVPPPRKRRLAELARLQRIFVQGLLQPLDAGISSQGSVTTETTAEGFAHLLFVSDERASAEVRFQIYHRQYWYRLFDSLYEDFPGLAALLGPRKFTRLLQAYLLRYPSDSYTLWELGKHMERFLSVEPHWARPWEKEALAMARFEWAKVQAFFAPSIPTLGAEELLSQDPSSLRLQLQPHLQLLELNYRVHEWECDPPSPCKDRQAENAKTSSKPTVARKRLRVLPGKVALAIYRFQGEVRYRSLTERSFFILSRIRSGIPVAEACAQAFVSTAEGSPLSSWIEEVTACFQEWAALGWFALPAPPVIENAGQ
jgi:hypothetical protein